MAFRSPYPDYDVLAKWRSPSFDARTRHVLTERLTQIPARRFFTAEEWDVLESVTARLIPQPERVDPVPIVPWIDQALAEGKAGEGFRGPDMPEPPEAWRSGLGGIAREAAERHGQPFPALTAAQQDALLTDLQHGRVRTDGWRDLPSERFFTDVLLKTVVGIYYAHPAAWSEIGFGGPASPRGYVRLDPDRRDPWEGRETPDG